MQHVTSFAGRLGIARDTKMITPIVNLDIESTFYLAQVLIELAAQVGQPLVIGGFQIEFLNDFI